FESERTGHPAASGRKDLVIEAKAVEDGPLRFRLDDGVVMTVDLYERRPRKPRQGRVGAVPVHELRKEERLPADALRDRIVRKKTRQFVAKRADARRLQPDDGRAALDLRTQARHGLKPQPARGFEHAPVVKRTAAAQRSVRNDYPKAEALQHLRRRDRGLRAE